MLLPLFALFGSSQAFFRLPCHNALVTERVDTIVAPGKVASHAHTIFGGSAFAVAGSDFAASRKSECSSCAATADMSNYWTPGLFIQWENGSFTSVPTAGGGMNIYYLSRKHAKTEVIVPFPDGLKMLAGATGLRSYDPTNVMAQNIRWNCTGLPGTQPVTPQAEFKTPNFPLRDCPNGLRSMVVFPSCWNGKDLDSPTHNTHVSYPLTGGENGACPTGFPVRIPTLRFETTYATHQYSNSWELAMNKTQPFVLSNGDGTGYGYHADFFNGWDSSILQKVIDTCTDAGMDNIANCTVLNTFDMAAVGTCRKTPDINEIVQGTLATLPGCNPVTYAPFVAATCPLPSPPLFSPTTVYRHLIPPPGSNVLANDPQVLVNYNKWDYTKCLSYDAGARPLTNMLKVNGTTMSIANCLDAATTAGFQYAALANTDQCWAGDIVGNTTIDIGFGECASPCKGSPLQICGGRGRIVDLYTFMGTPVKPVVPTPPKKAASTPTPKMVTAPKRK